MNVEITSFGYLHGDPPSAHITLDLRHHFRDPHVRPELRNLTANDYVVRHAVLDTPGISELINSVPKLVRAFQDGPTPGVVRIAVGCAGGRHRAATVAMALGSFIGATVTHRDIGKPVVERNAKGDAS